MAYGKVFESLYTGSMVGAGLNVFTVWTYCIATAKPPGTVELNPAIMATVFGCTVNEVDDAIAKLCEPDPRSRSKEEDGRRLLKEGEFLYSLPTWQKYNELRNEEERRTQNRESQRRWRERQADGVSESKQASADVSKNKPVLSSSTSSERRERERGDVERPGDVTEQTWADWLAHRKSKRATVSATVINRLRKDGMGAGMMLEEAMAHSVAQGYAGFFPPTKVGANGKAPKPVEHIRNAPLGTPSCSCEGCVKARTKMKEEQQA